MEEPSDATARRRGPARARAVIDAAFTAVILWFTLVAAAPTLDRHHHTASSAQDAALALRPLAGAVAADLFAAGLVTPALVALPVLMASTAYVVGAPFNWRRGLSERLGRARRFYAILVASIGLALVASVAKIPLIGMLVAASVTGGSGTPIGLVLLVRDPRIIGPAAHLPAASHRGLGRHRHRQQPRPARHPRRSRRHAPGPPAHDRPSLRRAEPGGRQTRRSASRRFSAPAVTVATTLPPASDVGANRPSASISGS